MHLCLLDDLLLELCLKCKYDIQISLIVFSDLETEKHHIITNQNYPCKQTEDLHTGKLCHCPDVPLLFHVVQALMTSKTALCSMAFTWL